MNVEELREETVYLECRCGCPLHGIILTNDPEWNEKSITFFLYKYEGFWKRLWTCFFYLFGRGRIDYDSYLLKEEDKEKWLWWLQK